MASAAGWMARRVEGAYSTEICDRDATKPDGPPRRKTPRSIFQTRTKVSPATTRLLARIFHARPRPLINTGLQPGVLTRSRQGNCFNSLPPRRGSR